MIWRRRAGFTLIEVLGVILVTTLLLSVAIDFYINLSRQATRASDNTRELRRATAILDRVAQDLEHALLVRKPAEVDPLAHPWIFLAESEHSELGADQIKFVRRQSPRSSDGAASDIELVAYTLRHSEDGSGFELRRWSSPVLPESLDRSFPVDGDPDSLLLADGIASFTARFLDPNGEWVETWDSSLLVDSSELPQAVELDLSLTSASEPETQLALAEEPAHRVRQVQLPLRPLDLEALLNPDAGEGNETGEDENKDLADKTLADCIDFSKIGAADAAAVGLSATELGTLSALAQQAGDTPFAPYAGLLAGHPALKPQCR